MIFNKRGVPFFTAVFIYFQKKVNAEDLRAIIPKLRDWLENKERKYIKKYTISYLTHHKIIKRVGNDIALTKEGERAVSERLEGAPDIYKFMNNEVKKLSEVIRAIRVIQDVQKWKEDIKPKK